MANEIWHSYDSSKVLYALIYRMADQFIWDVGSAAFEAVGTWNDARVGECDVAMTANGDIHFVTFPVAITTAGVYYVQIRERIGASPDTDDLSVAQGVMYWDGVAELNISTITYDIYQSANKQTQHYDSTTAAPVGNVVIGSNAGLKDVIP